MGGLKPQIMSKSSLDYPNNMCLSSIDNSFISGYFGGGDTYVTPCMYEMSTILFVERRSTLSCREPLGLFQAQILSKLLKLCFI